MQGNDSMAHSNQQMVARERMSTTETAIQGRAPWQPLIFAGFLSDTDTFPKMVDFMQFTSTPAALKALPVTYLKKGYMPTLHVSLLETKTFLAQRSLWMKPLLAKYCIPSATC